MIFVKSNGEKIEVKKNLYIEQNKVLAAVTARKKLRYFLWYRSKINAFYKAYSSTKLLPFQVYLAGSLAAKASGSMPIFFSGAMKHI